MQAIGRRIVLQMSLFATVAAAGAGACGQLPPPAADDALLGLPTDVEAVSLLGEPLRRPELPAATRDLYELRLSDARRAWEQAPTNADSIIWLGRRTAYLGRYREAISIFTDGIAKHPDDPRIYRHRGHRYLSVRQIDRGIDDLSRAAELIRGRPDQVEPDGIPNAMNTPTSTLQSNVWYHLGLAHYLKGDFRRALAAYHEAMRVSTNPDMLVATSHWLYMTLRRMGRAAEAERVLSPITREMPIVENAAYHRLLLLYKGVLPADSLAAPGNDALTDATIGYGVGNWHLYNGRRADALQVFRRVVSGGSWASFGYIAAEAELARDR